MKNTQATFNAIIKRSFQQLPLCIREDVVKLLTDAINDDPDKRPDAAQCSTLLKEACGLTDFLDVRIHLFCQVGTAKLLVFVSQCRPKDSDKLLGKLASTEEVQTCSDKNELLQLAKLLGECLNDSDDQPFSSLDCFLLLHGLRTFI